MQGRVYTVVFDAVSVTAAQDLFELTPADDKPIELVRLKLFQTSDVGDAAAENLQLKVIRGNTTSGSGGTAPTPAPVSPGAPAAGFTAEVNNTTVATSGTAVTLMADGWNIAVGCDIWFDDEERLGANQSNTLIRITQTAPADALTMSGTLWVRELG